MFATMADAHREWHRNSGVPMGTAGCPQDACHPADDEDGMEVTCENCFGAAWLAEVYEDGVLVGGECGCGYWVSRYMPGMEPK